VGCSLVSPGTFAHGATRRLWSCRPRENPRAERAWNSFLWSSFYATERVSARNAWLGLLIPERSPNIHDAIVSK
jgi:hypothetical protein